ncbi:MAG: Holliday junction resolvase RuvX [Limibacillus sp.]|jgi:putative Holliday junction resolvase
MAASITEIAEIPALLGPRERVLGLDFGDKTIGLALSDSALTLASPLETIQRRKFMADAEALKAVIADRKVGALVLGLPVNMDGSEGKRCQQTRGFAENLQKEAGVIIPLALWDERLSTSAVERFLIDEADMTRKRRGEVVDKMAAAYILQGALDAMRRTLG